jgi:hypothetical protein
MFALDAEILKETWKYLAMNVTKPVDIVCSITTANVTNNHVGLNNNAFS